MSDEYEEQAQDIADLDYSNMMAEAIPTGWEESLEEPGGANASIGGLVDYMLQRPLDDIWIADGSVEVWYPDDTMSEFTGLGARMRMQGESQASFIMRMWNQRAEPYWPGESIPGQIVDYLLQYGPDTVRVDPRGVVVAKFPDGSTTEFIGAVPDE